MQSKELGYGILLDTFLVRTLLVPSIVVLLGRWNWWPSSSGQPEPGSDAILEPSLEPALVEAQAIANLI